MILQLHKIFEDGTTEFVSQAEIEPYEPPMIAYKTSADTYNFVSGLPERLMAFEFRDWHTTTHKKFVDDDYEKTWRWLVCDETADVFMRAAPDGKARILAESEA